MNNEKYVFWREMTIENLANNMLNKFKKQQQQNKNKNRKINFFSIEEISFYLNIYLNSFSCITSSQT